MSINDLFAFAGLLEIPVSVLLEGAAPSPDEPNVRPTD